MSVGNAVTLTYSNFDKMAAFILYNSGPGWPFVYNLYVHKIRGIDRTLITPQLILITSE